jgi:hypothetical protein
MLLLEMGEKVRGLDPVCDRKLVAAVSASLTTGSSGKYAIL